MKNINSFITLTTDFGLSDNYVGVMKGVIYGINPDAKIIDITHQIKRQDIYHAALLIDSAWKYFPKHSIHTIVVDPGVGSDRKVIALKKKNAIFVAPDNGLLSLLYNPDKDKVIHCNKKEYWLDQISNTFHGRDIFSPIAGHLSRGVPVDQIGTEIPSMNTIEIETPVIKTDRIIGEVIYIDVFGNCITNIESELVGEEYTVDVKDVTIDGGKDLFYSSMPKGEPISLIDSFDRVEIAIRNGKASEILDIHCGDECILWKK